MKSSFPLPAWFQSPYFYPLLLLIIVVLTGLLYGYQVPDYPVLDDQPSLSILSMLHQGGGAGWWQLVWGNHSGISPRSIPMLSFVFDAWRAPDDLAAMRHTSIVLHLLTGVILFAWLKSLLVALVDNKRFASVAALCVTAFWLLAPIQISTVYYPVQRMAMWPVFFTLIALWHYTHLRLRGACWSSGKLFFHLGVIYLIWLPLGVLSKENGILIPLFLALIEWGLLRHYPSPFARGLRWWHGLVVVVFLLGAAVILIDGQLIRYGGPGSLRDFNVTDRVATQAFVLWDYARQILFPNIAKMGLYHDDFKIWSITAWPSIIMLLLTAAVFISSLWALRSRSIHVRLIGFGIAFFFVGHLLESTVFNLELYFEHRNYLPSIGLLLAAVVALNLLMRSLASSNLWLGGVLVVYFGMTIINTAIELGYWRSHQRMIEKVWVNHPGSPRTNFLFAEYAMAVGNPELALEVLAQAPNRLTRPADKSERERLVALRQIYYSLVNYQSPAPEYYDRVLHPWPGSATFERAGTLRGMVELPKDQLDFLDWPQLARTPDAMLDLGVSLKGRPRASFMLQAAYLALRFDDVERAQRYFLATHAQTKDYLPWTTVPLFRFAIDAGNLDAARGYISDLEQDAHWAKLYPIQLENMRDELRAQESSNGK